MHITKQKTDNLKITSGPYLEPEPRLIGHISNKSSRLLKIPPNTNKKATHTHTHPKRNTMIIIRYKAWLARIQHPMACLFLKLKNATLATIPLFKEYKPLCSTWQHYASKYLIKSALSI